MRSRGAPGRAAAEHRSDRAVARHVRYTQTASHFLGRRCPYAPPQRPFLRRFTYFFFFSKKSSTQRSAHPGSGFWRKEGCNRHAGPATAREKGTVKHPCQRKTPPIRQRSCYALALHAPLPGARSKLTVLLVQGRHRASQQAPSLSARGRAGHANTAPAGNCTSRHAATSPRYL